MTKHSDNTERRKRKKPIYFFSLPFSSNSSLLYIFPQRTILYDGNHAFNSSLPILQNIKEKIFKWIFILQLNTKGMADTSLIETFNNQFRFASKVVVDRN